MDTRFEMLKEIRGFPARMAGTVINRSDLTFYGNQVPDVDHRESDIVLIQKV
jgi:hypothetical protein